MKCLDELVTNSPKEVTRQIEFLQCVDVEIEDVIHNVQPLSEYHLS